MEDMSMPPRGSRPGTTNKSEPKGKGKVAGTPPTPVVDETTRQRIAFDLSRGLIYRMRQRANARKFRSGQAKEHTLSSLAEECIRAHLDTLEKTEGPA
jgi:hypothetical protein